MNVNKQPVTTERLKTSLRQYEEAWRHRWRVKHDGVVALVKDDPRELALAKINLESCRRAMVSADDKLQRKVAGEEAEYFKALIEEAEGGAPMPFPAAGSMSELCGGLEAYYRPIPVILTGSGDDLFPCYLWGDCPDWMAAMWRELVGMQGSESSSQP